MSNNLIPETAMIAVSTSICGIEVKKQLVPQINDGESFVHVEKCSIFSRYFSISAEQLFECLEQRR